MVPSLRPSRPRSPHPQLTSRPHRRASNQRARGQAGEYHCCCHLVHVQFLRGFPGKQEGHCQGCSLCMAWGPAACLHRRTGEAGGAPPALCRGTGRSSDSQWRSGDCHHSPRRTRTETDRSRWLVTFGRLTPHKGSYDHGRCGQQSAYLG